MLIYLVHLPAEKKREINVIHSNNVQVDQIKGFLKDKKHAKIPLFYSKQEQ